MLNWIGFVVVASIAPVVTACFIGTSDQCSCDIDRLEIRCSGLENTLDEVMLSLAAETRYIVLRKNWVLDETTLRAEHIAGLRKLVGFDISHNRIDKIEPDTFSNLRMLEDVDLSRNKIRVLENNVFSGSLPSLRNINLSGNKIIIILDGTFNAASNLESLDLTENPVVFLGGRSFEGLVNLQYLTMSGFQLTEFPSKPLSSLVNLRRLELRNFPAITGIPDAAFSENSRLTFLIISDVPNISELGWGSNCLQNLSQLRHLTLRTCNLPVISAVSFENLKQLKQLDISNNPIGIIKSNDLSALSNLEELFLVSTALNDIQAGAFTRMVKLKHLNLANNRLTTIDRGAFPVDISCLRKLTITNNVWNCDCGILWIVTSPITIENNGVTCTSPPIYQGSNLTGVVARLARYERCYICTIKDFPSPNYTQVDVGGTVDLPCYATGTPLPTVTWYTPSGLVISSAFTSTPRILRHNLIGKHLFIRDVSIADAGVYICVAANGVGVDQKTLKLQVRVNDGRIIEQRTQFTLSGNITALRNEIVTKQSNVLACPSQSPVIMTVLIGALSAMSAIGLLLSFLLGVWGYSNEKQFKQLKKKLREANTSEKRKCNSEQTRPQSPLAASNGTGTIGTVLNQNLGYGCPRNLPSMSNYRTAPSLMPEKPRHAAMIGDRKVDFRNSISSGYGSFGNGTTPTKPVASNTGSVARGMS